MKISSSLKSLFILLYLITACKEKTNQPPNMISMPQFEFVSQITKNNSSRNVNISLDAFYISNEITNKEYREFTDWAKENPEEILGKPRKIIVKKNPEPGRTKVWTVPYLINMSDLLPSLIDSNAMYKVDKRYKDYFTDKKYDDFPVVGVSRNAAEFYCVWLVALERETIVLRKGQIGPDGIKVKEKSVMMSSPGYGYYRIPIELEWEYVARQPYKRKYNNDHQLHKVTEGNTNRWGISHLNDNVSEWVSSPDDTLSISRGRNWRSGDNSSDRLRIHPDSSSGLIGFRIARTYKPEVINSEKK
jgi:formylglycine-generating enzyme required for sulfatase activity